MSRSSLAAGLLSGIALLLFAGTGRAEINYGESLEWMAADCDLVVTGKVVQVAKVAGKGPKPYEVATIEVARTLKGQPPKKLDIVLRNYNGPAAEDWQADGIPLLLFVQKRANAKETESLPPGFDWVLRDDGNEHCAVLLGKPKRHWTHTVPAMTRDFDVLKEPEAIVNHVAAAIRAIPPDWKKASKNEEAPGDSAVYKLLWSGSTVYLTVPDGIAAPKPAEVPQKLPQATQDLLDRLNAWHKEECDVHERPQLYPNRRPSGETNGWINSNKQKLGKLGVSVRWSPDKKRYEVLEKAK